MPVLIFHTERPHRIRRIHEANYMIEVYRLNPKPGLTLRKSSIGYGVDITKILISDSPGLEDILSFEAIKWGNAATKIQEVTKIRRPPKRKPKRKPKNEILRGRG